MRPRGAGSRPDPRRPGDRGGRHELSRLDPLHPGGVSAAASLLERNVALEGDLRYERFEAPAIQSALSGAYLAEVLSELGRFAEATGPARPPCVSPRRRIIPTRCISGRLGLGHVHLGRGDLPRATRVLERDLDLCRTWQFTPDTDAPRPSAAAYALTGRRTRRSRWWPGPSRSSAVVRITTGRRYVLLAPGWRTSWPGGPTRPEAWP